MNELRFSLVDKQCEWLHNVSFYINKYLFLKQVCFAVNLDMYKLQI